MIKRFSKARGAIALVLAPALGFLFRLFSYWALGALFKAWNLSEAALPYAPAWAQSLVSLTDAIADCFFLIGALLPLFALTREKKRTPVKRLWIYPAFGALLSVLTVGIFLLIGSARMPERRAFYHFTQALVLILMEALSIVVYAYFLRRAPMHALSGKLPLLRLILSALGQAGICVLAKGFSPVSAVNALFTGACLFILFEKTKSVLPESMLVFSFRLFTRFIFGYPDLGGAYPVSEAWLTGGNAGTADSLLLTFYLFLFIALYIFRTHRAKGVKNV